MLQYAQHDAAQLTYPFTHARYRVCYSFVCLLNRGVAVEEAMLEVDSCEAIKAVIEHEETIVEFNAILNAMKETIEEHRA